MLRSSGGAVAQPSGEPAAAGGIVDKDQGEIHEAAFAELKAPVQRQSWRKHRHGLHKATSIPTAKCLLFGRLVCAPLHHKELLEKRETNSSPGRNSAGALMTVICEQ